MLALREGVPIYAPASPGRFNGATYGPIFYLLGSRLVNPANPGYRALRAVSALATIALAAGCALLAWWLAGSYLAAALASLIFLAYAFVNRFGTTARSDTAAVLLSFCGFLVAYRYQNGRRILLAVPLLALGFYYKQQFVVAPLAIIAYLVLEKRIRAAMEFTALLALAGLSLLAVFEFLVFPHQQFLLHFFSYNLIPFGGPDSHFRLLLAPIIALIPLLMALRFLRAFPNKLVACYAGWAVLLLPFMLLKKGAEANYFFELIAVLSPVLAALLEKKLAEPLEFVPLLCFLGIALASAQFSEGGGFPVPQQDFARDQALQAFLRENSHPGAPGLGIFTGDLLRAGLTTPITDLYQYGWLICKGTLADKDLLAELRGRRFEAILVNNDLRSEADAHDPLNVCLTEPVHQAITQNYRLAASFAFHTHDKEHYYAWVPRN
jgi:hypothetical protein